MTKPTRMIKAALTTGAPLLGAPQDRWVRNGLLIIADAATQIAGLSYEAHFRHWLWVGARLRKRVADFSELALGLLPPCIEFRAIHLAGGILQVPGVRAKQLLCIRVAEGNDLAV